LFPRLRAAGQRDPGRRGTHDGEHDKRGPRLRRPSVPVVSATQVQGQRHEGDTEGGADPAGRAGTPKSCSIAGNVIVTMLASS
jgi:hypothetical protein